MYDLRKLRGRIIECYGSQGAFAYQVKRSQAYVSEVLNGRSYLEQRDIDKWAAALNIPLDNIGVYFFTRIYDS